MIDYVLDPFPTDPELRALLSQCWEKLGASDYAAVLARSLAHVGAFDGETFVGFVNVAWDGGAHAFILDTCVAPHYQRRGIATELVRRAADAARERGAQWLHVDYNQHLDWFYQGCGFVPTKAGLIRLAPQ